MPHGNLPLLLHMYLLLLDQRAILMGTWLNLPNLKEQSQSQCLLLERALEQLVWLQEGSILAWAGGNLDSPQEALPPPAMHAPT